MLTSSAPSDETPEGALVAALRTLLQAGDLYRTRVGSRFDLGWTEIQAVGHLFAAGELGQTELAGLIGITTPAATALVDRLERGDIATRSPHPQDRRRTLVRLTERGLEVIALSRQWTAHAFDEIPDGERESFARQLRAVAENLVNQADHFADDDGNLVQAG